MKKLMIIINILVVFAAGTDFVFAQEQPGINSNPETLSVKRVTADTLEMKYSDESVTSGSETGNIDDRKDLNKYNSSENNSTEIKRKPISTIYRTNQSKRSSVDTKPKKTEAGNKSAELKCVKVRNGE